MTEINVTKEALDAQARDLVLELGRRVYQVDLMTKEIEQIKAQILELNIKAYRLEHPEESTEQAEEAKVEA